MSRTQCEPRPSARTTRAVPRRPPARGAAARPTGRARYGRELAAPTRLTEGGALPPAAITDVGPLPLDAVRRAHALRDEGGMHGTLVASVAWATRIVSRRALAAGGRRLPASAAALRPAAPPVYGLPAQTFDSDQRSGDPPYAEPAWRS